MKNDNGKWLKNSRKQRNKRHRVKKVTARIGVVVYILNLLLMFHW